MEQTVLFFRRRRRKRSRFFFLLAIIGIGLSASIYYQNHRTSATATADNNKALEALEKIDSSLQALEKIDSTIIQLQMRLDKLKKIKSIKP
jgi:uncharacterized membrane protein